MASEPEPSELERLAERIADETPVDWRERRPDATTKRLQAIERIASAFRTSARDYEAGHAQSTDAAPGAAVAAPVLFRWKHLDVVEHIGSGTAGDVYRAIDTTLQREVALKLREAPDASTERTTRFLQEARALARVRHENVLTVHGADVADDHVGLWSELVRGKTLEERLGEGGRLGAREAALLGLDLCRALAAIHEAGLVHGDVKASNVMRAEGGRTILLDFSSGREVGAAGDLGPTGTPLALPPEVLEGHEPDPGADLYSLGTLLYRLVTGRYPIVAATFAELRAKHAKGERTPLRDLRPDLPRGFVDVVERALGDPPWRFASAGEMEAELAGTLAASAAPERVPSRTRTASRWAVAVAFGLAVVLVVVWRGARTALEAGFRVDATLFRANEEGDESLERGGEVRVGDQLFLEIEGNAPMHVYVLDEDASGNVYVLFPVPGLAPTNPLPAGTRHRLPGRLGGVSQDWEVTSADGRETILVVSSKRPLEPLERELASIPAASRGVQLAYAELDPSAIEGLRGVAGMKPSRSRVDAESGRLASLAEDYRRQARTAEDLWIREFGLASRPE